MSIKNLRLSLLLSAGIIGSIKGQDIHFSQLNETPLMINPANTGLFDGYQRVILNYRDQWTVPNSPFKTMAASIDAGVGMRNKRAAYLGIGGYVFQDKAGASNWSRLKADLYLNGILKAGRSSKFALGVGAGFGQNSADISKLTYGNQYNGQGFSSDLPSYENIQFQKHNFFDVSAGINYEFDRTKVNFDADNFYWLKIGFAAYHINQPVLKYSGDTKSKLGMKLVGSVSGRYDIQNSKVSILPSVIYMQQNKFMEITGGAFARVRFKEQTKITGYKHEIALWLGCFYRNSDAIIPQLLVEIYGFNVGFAYDYTLSKYKKANKGVGGFEISLRWVNLRDGLFKRAKELKGGGKLAPGSTPAKT